MQTSHMLQDFCTYAPGLLQSTFKRGPFLSEYEIRALHLAAGDQALEGFEQGCLAGGLQGPQASAGEGLQELLDPAA